MHEKSVISKWLVSMSEYNFMWIQDLMSLNDDWAAMGWFKGLHSEWHRAIKLGYQAGLDAGRGIHSVKYLYWSKKVEQCNRGDA